MVRRAAAGFIAALLASQPAAAAEHPVGAAVLSQGGAAAASSYDNAAIAASPGLLALHDRYDLQAWFGLGPRSGLQWSVSAVDARTSDYLALGLSYSGEHSTPPLDSAELPGWKVAGTSLSHRKRWHDLTVAGGVPFLNRRLAIGVNGNFTFFQHDLVGQGMYADLDVGLGLRPFDGFAVGLAARNLLPPRSEQAEDRPLSAALGLELRDLEVGGLMAEVTWSPELATGPLPIGLGVGGEKVVGPVLLRGGFRFDPIDPRSEITWGLAVGSEAGELAYGIGVPLGAGPETLPGIVHRIEIRARAPTLPGPDAW